jgi:hypothetical protein
MSKKKSDPILIIPIMGRGSESGLKKFPASFLEEAKSYATGNYSLKLYADNSGREIPSEWKANGATVLAKKVKGCVIYFTEINGKNERI